MQHPMFRQRDLLKITTVPAVLAASPACMQSSIMVLCRGQPPAGSSCFIQRVLKSGVYCHFKARHTLVIALMAAGASMAAAVLLTSTVTARTSQWAVLAAAWKSRRCKKLQGAFDQHCTLIRARPPCCKHDSEAATTAVKRTLRQ